MTDPATNSLRRASWLDAVGLASRSLSEESRAELQRLDEALFEEWNLGENIFLAWTRDADGLKFLSVRHYRTMEPFSAEEAPGHAFINALLEQPKFHEPGDFAALLAKVGKAGRVLKPRLGATLPADLVSRLVTRYSVSLVHDRAVVLLDIVGFSLHSPMEQLAMLNSLSYSVNSAYRQLVSEHVQINFARSSTGDGFYIWNRARTVEANIALYKLLMLLLADNALARKKARRFPVPQLRAAFHVGEHYEFYQVEALNPTTFSYIVGPVTIELARIVEKALPGQILLGDFNIAMRDADGGRATTYSATDFIARTEELMAQLTGLAVAHDRIAGIRCYVTGPRLGEDRFGIRRYQVRDKHGLLRKVYNAKMNIRFERNSPIYLGYQDGDLHREGVLDASWAEA